MVSAIGAESAFWLMSCALAGAASAQAAAAAAIFSAFIFDLPGWKGSATCHALRVDVKRIDRRACRHEQPVAVAAAEADVGAALRQVDAADQLALGVEDV